MYLDAKTGDNKRKYFSLKRKETFKNKQDLVSKWILEVRDTRKGSLGCLPHFWVL